jgi:hypothetical protein
MLPAAPIWREAWQNQQDWAGIARVLCLSNCGKIFRISVSVFRAILPLGSRSAGVLARVVLTAVFELRPTRRKAAALERVRAAAEAIFWQVIAAHRARWCGRTIARYR